MRSLFIRNFFKYLNYVSLKFPRNDITAHEFFIAPPSEHLQKTVNKIQ